MVGLGWFCFVRGLVLVSGVLGGRVCLDGGSLDDELWAGTAVSLSWRFRVRLRDATASEGLRGPY